MESSTGAAKPTEEDVRLRAYYLYLERERDGQKGTAVDDWLLAEAELSDQVESRLPQVTPPRGPTAMPPTALRTPRTAID